MNSTEHKARDAWKSLPPDQRQALTLADVMERHVVICSNCGLTHIVGATVLFTCVCASNERKTS